MTARVSDVVRGWLGWCPDSSTAPVRKKLAWPDTSISTRQTDVFLVKNDVIIDYGSTGMSIRLFTIILAGTIIGLFTIMRYGLFEIWSSLGILILSVFILGAALRMVYQDIKRACIKFAPDAIIIRRSLSSPIILEKEAITTIEVRENIHHSQRWLFRGAIAIFFAGIIPSILFSGNSLLISRIISQVSFTVFMIYYLAVTVFFGLLFYHQHIRSCYPDVLAIHTNNKKIIGLYTNGPREMSDMLAEWQAGAH